MTGEKSLSKLILECEICPTELKFSDVRFELNPA